MRLHLIVLCCLLQCLMFGCYSARLETMKSSEKNRIVYKPASDSLNDHASALLRRLIIKKDFSSNTLLKKNLICGPYLWKQVKDMENFRDAKGAGVTLYVDGIIMDSKVLWEEKVADLLQFCFADVDENELTIRKLNQDEIRVYWAYISFDIEEPVFMVETGKKKYVVDFGNDTLGLFWFDDFTTLGIDRSDFEHTAIEPISELTLPVGIFDLSLNIRSDLPDSVVALLPFISGNLFFTNRPTTSVIECVVSNDTQIKIPLIPSIFNGKDYPETKNKLFEDLGLRITPAETRFGRFGSYCGRFQNGRMNDFGEMIMFWDNAKRGGFLLCYFDRPCTIEGYITQQNLVVDIEVLKPGFYCIGNEKLPDGKTLMKEIDPPSDAFYFIGIEKKKQNW